jgi:hypothetical protein
VVALDHGECGLREGSIKQSGAGGASAGDHRPGIAPPYSRYVYGVLQQGRLGHVRAYALSVPRTVSQHV